MSITSRGSRCARKAFESAVDPAVLQKHQRVAVSHGVDWVGAGYPVDMAAWERYVEFVYHHAQGEDAVCQVHHVFPKRVFPTFARAVWNLVPLTEPDHLLAHRMLAQMFPSCAPVAAALVMMTGLSHGAQAPRSHQLLADKLQVRSSEGVIYVNRDDPRVLSGDLRHFNHGRKPTRVSEADPTMRVPLASGRVVVRDASGKHFQVCVGDPRVASGELTRINTGTVTVVDAQGNCFRVAVDDPRYLSGELVAQTKGTVCVVDPATGKRFRTSVTDPRWVRGELTHANKGTVSVVDPATGERLRVATSDPRYLVGELLHQNKGRHQVRPEGFVHPNKGKVVAFTPEGARTVVAKDDPRLLDGRLATRPKYRRGRHAR